MTTNTKTSPVKLAAILLLAALPLGAQNTLQVTFMGRVLPAFSLQPVATVGDANYEVYAIPQGRDRVLVVANRRGPEVAPSGRVTVILALRTNAESYRLQATQVGGGTPVVVDVGMPQASGDGSRVAVQSLMSFAGASAQPLGHGWQAVAAGPRISLKGSFSSANNALLVPVSLAFDSGDSAGSYQILLTLGA